MTILYPARGFGDPRELAARMRQRITIQQATETPDTAGGTVRSWGDVAVVWAEVLPLSGGRIERLFAEQLQAEVTHRMMIRYRGGLDPAMRVLYAGRTFNIRSITNIAEANVMLELMVEEGVAV